METFIHLWCVNCLSNSRWDSLRQKLKNKIMQHFIDTLYCTSKSFDELFMVLFSSTKSDRLIFQRNESIGLSPKDLQDIAQDILKYSSSMNLQYLTFNFLQSDFVNESVADYPLKAFSLCPCTRRPIYVALYLTRHDVVRLLLNCGARIPYEDFCSCTRSHPLVNILSIVSKIPGCCLSHQEMLSSMKNCAKTLEALLVDLSCSSPLWPKVCAVLAEMREDGMLQTVPDLKHICRTYIRRISKEKKWILCLQVWKDLNLPLTLVSYITLDF